MPFDLPLRSAPLTASVDRVRLALADGAATTLHVATYERARMGVRVAVLPRPTPLMSWCRAEGIDDAIVGGFFVRPDGVPLGEVRVGGAALPTVPFDAPWGAVRACVHAADGDVRIARRAEIAADPAGDLLQAGPLLVRDAAATLADGDLEGFSAGAGQFDSDITLGRYPRAALAIDDTRLLAVACDGRADDEAGLTLQELAETLVALGAEHALNLDGGGSASLVCGGWLRNRPREEHGIELVGGRPISTALVFEPLA